MPKAQNDPAPNLYRSKFKMADKRAAAEPDLQLGPRSIAMAQISSRPQHITLNMQTAALVRAAKAW
jgi:hypothetical protein